MPAKPCGGARKRSSKDQYTKENNMGLRHPFAIAFEKELNAVLDDVDHLLEARFGDRYDLHPSRAAKGQTGNPTYDGLFQLSASFSAGYGTELGRGYVLEVRLVTMENVPGDERAVIENVAATLLEQHLDLAFPKRALKLQRDGTVYKIVGDLSLGSL
jgi:hypothetical protein